MQICTTIKKEIFDPDVSYGSSNFLASAQQATAPNMIDYI